MSQIQDEYTFTTDLSYTLSSRYKRPESSILVTVSHSACLLFGGSFDPAYTMTITALSSQLQLITNKRNATLLAKSMEETLGVRPERGVIKFQAVAEENLATNGQTLAGMVEDLEREMSDDNTNLIRSISRATKKGLKRQSTRSLKGLRGASNMPSHEETLNSPAVKGE